MEQHESQPRLYQEAEIMKVVRPGPADSPPPNCAICLGICTNKCFTDCCLHQFCFSCLLEWSKIKAECPLCKQPFKSIIYNIKSNLEYEEHIITNPEREVQGEDLLLDEDVHTEYLFLPNGPRPQRHFQYRTTFTLEPGGEFAIQQLLLSHPRTNSIYLPTDRYLHHRLNTHTVHQRRNIYNEDLWVEPQPDVTGRYRDCTPIFFRENPAQTHRIIPWLNRELTALMVDYVDIYTVQERIMEMLCQVPIQSSSFRTWVMSYLGNRTEHFIHEFYNFVRSPYDMIGYDRHATYSQHRPAVYSHSVSDDDSDVRVVDSPSNDDCIYVPPRTPEVIVINSDSSSDSDVIIRYPSPPATPPIVNLVDSDSDDNITVSSRQPVVENERLESNRSPQLPIKIRLKRNRNSAEICKFYKHKEKRMGKMKRYASDSDSDSYHPKSESEYSTAHISTSSDCSSSDDLSDSNYSSDINPNTNKIGHKIILKRVKVKSSRKHKHDSKYVSKSSKYRHKKINIDARDISEKPYKSKKSSKKSKKQKKAKRKESETSKSRRIKRIKMERSDLSHSDKDSSSEDEGDCRRRRKPIYEVKTEIPHSGGEQTNSFQQQDVETPTSTVTSNNDEVNEKDLSSASSASTQQDLGVAGPSQGPSLRSVIVKGNNMWYSRPDLDASSTDNNSD